MRTPEELKELAKKVKAKKDQEFNDYLRKEREDENQKKTRAIEQAKKDVEKAVNHLEWLVSNHRVHHDNNDYNKEFYVIDNYYNTYAKKGELKECYFYDDCSKEYWKQLTKELKGLGYNATLDETHNEVFDSMTTYETYCIIIKL